MCRPRKRAASKATSHSSSQPDTAGSSNDGRGSPILRLRTPTSLCSQWAMNRVEKRRTVATRVACNACRARKTGVSHCISRILSYQDSLVYRFNVSYALPTRIGMTDTIPVRRYTAQMRLLQCARYRVQIRYYYQWRDSQCCFKAAKCRVAEQTNRL